MGATQDGLCYNSPFSLSPSPCKPTTSTTLQPYHLVNHITMSPYHLVTLSPCHPITLSPCHLATFSLTSPLRHDTLHQGTLLSYHPIDLASFLPLSLPLPLSSSSPRPRLILVLILASSSSSPRLISYLCTPLSIPFLGPCILPILIPVSLISFVIPVYHLYSSFHLHPSSRPLVSPFVLFSTCSLILDHVLPVFYSHHGHPSPGSRISLIFVSSLVLTQLGPCSLSL